MTIKAQTHTQISLFQTKSALQPDAEIVSVKVILEAPKSSVFVRKVPLINKYMPNFGVDDDNFRLLNSPKP